MEVVFILSKFEEDPIAGVELKIKFQTSVMGQVIIQILSRKIRLTRFSVKLKFQDRAKCGKMSKANNLLQERIK